MNPTLLDALGLGKNLTTDERLDLLHKLNEALTDDECQLTLSELLKRRPVATPEGWYSEYMHELCCLLGRQQALKPQFASTLSALASDPLRDEVIRDYALQHLRLLWEEADSSLRGQIVGSLEVLAAGESPTAASSLLSLHLLGSSAAGVIGNDTPQLATDSRAYELSNERMEPLVSQIFANPPSASNVVARMTAVRIVKERAMRGHLSVLRRIASDDSGEHAVVRMAAIAALAELGDSSDLTFLGTLNRRDPRIDAAIRHIHATNP